METSTIRVASYRLCLVFLSTLFAASLAVAQQRPPAVPLVTHDPYFSIWSMADKLTGDDTKHWTGARQPMLGLANIDGKVYRFMGGAPRGAMADQMPAMEQTSLSVMPTHTVYTFHVAGVTLTVTFFTPALPKDLDILSRPVTYLNFAASAQGEHEVSILLDVDPVIAVNMPDQAVTWGRSRAQGLTVLNVGSRDQRILNRPGDDLRIDWGYFHLAVPDATNATLVASRDAVRSFAASGALPVADDMDMPRMPREHAAHLAVALPMGKVAATPVSRHILLAYTEDYSMEYLGRRLRSYWQRNNITVGQMLSDAESQYSSLEERGQAFDHDLAADLERAGGPAYAQLAILAYRQTLAAHSLVADPDGTPMQFEKENFSCGCTATVDVMYPSAPFFLFFNPALLEAQMRPILQYAVLPRWKLPFAPHDLGVYPLANGPNAGEDEGSINSQMPVEESGNMLIMAAAIGHETGDWDLSRQYWGLFTKWAEYLREKGLDPANQLCTDDFTGHLAHNANLSIKAIEGLASYAVMARGVGKPDTADEYSKVAIQMAGQWQTMAVDGDHYKLAFDKPGTWSQKYNLVWDKILDFNLFPDKVRETELAFYLKHMNQYGLPLDIRADYTKLDWELWTATLAGQQPGSEDAFAALMTRIGRWVNEGPTRVPLTDWYDTKAGTAIHFQARSVVGGVYIKALSDKTLAARWQNRK